MLAEDEAKTLEFVSQQGDEMESLHQKTLSELKTITQRLDDISTKSKDIKEYIDCAEDYSYQFNVKIMGLPVVSKNESAEVSTDLCLRLFKLFKQEVSLPLIFQLEYFKHEKDVGWHS